MAGLLVVVVLLLVGSGAIARGQVADAEDGFVARIDQERSSRGLGTLAFAEDLQVVARRHAQRMADRGEPYHNRDLGTEVHDWEIVAENVGVGPDVDTIHRAFMDSAEHRDIILHPDLTQLGVGVVQTSDGSMWVVEVFRKPQQASTTTTPTTAAPAPPRSPAGPSGGRSAVPPATTVASTPPSSAVSTTQAASPLPRVEDDRGAVSASDVSTGGGRRVAVAQVAVGTSTPAMIDADVAGLARRVPPAAWVAAFLLAGVVGLQGQTLRRLGLVG